MMRKIRLRERDEILFYPPQMFDRQELPEVRGRVLEWKDGSVLVRAINGHGWTGWTAESVFWITPMDFVRRIPRRRSRTRPSIGELIG
jgi:hypothetical protein